MADDNIIALAHVLDTDKLREKYQEALASGCTPAFARSYVLEVAQTMAVAEAGALSLTPGVMEATLSQANVF